MALTHRVEPRHSFSLKDIDPTKSQGLSKKDGDSRLTDLSTRLAMLQEMHYAAGQNGILIVLQGIDTAGKDGTVRHVMAQINPAGCRVENFKVPTAEELAHDFLWRVHHVTPAHGMIAIFNRSHYEDVLVTRVHGLIPRKVWKRRYEEINDFEHLLVDSGTIVLKFFLHISSAEQRRRLLAREKDAEKAWKLSSSDWPEHELYQEYMDAYQDALNACSTPHAPWYIVPADHKWYRNLAVAQTIVDVLTPYLPDWHEALEQRGREALAARAAQRNHERDQGATG